MTKVSIQAAKTRLSQLVDRAISGEEVIIVRGKTPVAKLVRADSEVPARRCGISRIPSHKSLS